MKNQRLKRLLGFLMAVAVIITVMPAVVSAAEDAPSSWAEQYVFMARAAYGLGDASTYAGFKSGVTSDNFIPVLESMYEAFLDGFLGELLFTDEYLSRRAVLGGLYSLKATVMKETESVSDILPYFVENGLIKGRTSGDYQLDAICTVEEMIIFSVRMYEHIVYLLEDYSVGFLWQVHGGESTVYLFGSIHLSDGSLYPFSPAVEEAFAASENLVLEIIITDIGEEEEAYLIEKGLILDGTTIKDYISPAVYILYASVWESLGVPAMVYDYMQPWYAAMQLEALFAALSFGAESNEQIQETALLGIDMHFLLRALAAGKNIMELETFYSQIEMLASFSPELQEARLFGMIMMLIQPAEEPSEEQEAAAELTMMMLLEVFKTGDEDALAVFTGVNIDPEELSPIDLEFIDKMLTQRDIAMADKIAELLEDGDNGDYFIIVGAAHLIGENSIIGLLEEMGYTIERIK